MTTFDALSNVGTEFHNYRIVICFISQALGQSRTAQVQKDARVGEAEARRDANMAEAQAEMQRMEAKLANDTEIARAKRDFDLKKATYDVEVNTAKAEAEKAYELQVRFITIWCSYESLYKDIPLYQ